MNQPLADPLVESERNNPLRIFSLWLTFAVVFLRISSFHQAQTYLLKVNLRLLYVVGIPAILGTILCGGLQRAFRGKPAVFWTAYAVWMFVTIPTAVWPSDSLVHNAIPYLRTDLIMAYTVGGLVIGWKEFQSLMRCMAWGAFGTLLVARLFQNPNFQSRFGLEIGTVSNPNDFACHLLLVLPFLYWVVLTSKWFVAKLVCLGGIAYGIYLVVDTASRGALVAVVVVGICLLWWGSALQRVALFVFAPIAFLLVISTVSNHALNRIVSFSAESKDASAEALDSSASRRYLLEKSIEYAIKFPIFGLGPGGFPVYEGTHNLLIGTHGSWHGTHNTFTQVASECGIPGLIFYVGGLVSTFTIFFAAFRKASRRPDCADIRKAMLCVMLGMIGFVVSSSFLNFAYFFYQPLLGGIAIAAAAATKEEFAKRDAASAGLNRQMAPAAPTVSALRFPSAPAFPRPGFSS
jgi:O-antigen ligase